MFVKHLLTGLSAGLLIFCSFPAFAQPGPLQSYNTSIEAGTLTLPRFTPIALSYYPYHNGLRNDSTKWILGTQLISGTAQTADRIVDISSGGTYAYRNTSGDWTGTLTLLRNGHALMISNRHEARAITLEGYPADSIFYISPMPTGTVRCAAARVAFDHPINTVGLCWSDFHKSQNMRQGGDLVIDLLTRQITRRDSTDGWIGTMTHMRVGHPVMIQVNNLNTFDWMYNPTEE